MFKTWAIQIIKSNRGALWLADLVRETFTTAVRAGRSGLAGSPKVNAGVGPLEGLGGVCGWESVLLGRICWYKYLYHTVPVPQQFNPSAEV